jgi:NADH:ubiquinone oxidoreductase subunit 2 (subunit N)
VGYYLRVLIALFLEKPTAEAERAAQDRPEVVAPLAGATVLVCGILTLVLGLIPGLVVERFAGRAILDTLRVLP